MSCWVVPTIAAELWGIPVDHVLQRVRDGNLAHRVDEGFMFVDVAPTGGGGSGDWSAAPKRENPPTFTVLSEAEVEALCEEVERELDDGGGEELETQSPEDDEASVELGDWRAARQRVGATRIPPGRAKPQAA